MHWSWEWFGLVFVTAFVAGIGLFAARKLLG